MSTSLPVQRLAAGRGPAVVLLPGTASGQAVYAGLRPALAGRPLVGVDLPGFARSAPLPDDVPPTVESLTDAVAEALAAEGLGPDGEDGLPHVVGNSLGGAVALELVRRGAARSGVLVSPLGFQRPAEAWTMRWLLRALHGVAGALDARAERLLRSKAARTALLGTVAGRPWRVPPVTAVQMTRDTARTPQMARSVEATAGWPAPPLHPPHAPVLVLWGTRDAVLYPWQAKRVPAVVADARVVMLRGCGHVPFDDDPARVNGEVVRFLERVEADGPRSSAEA